MRKALLSIGVGALIICLCLACVVGTVRSAVKTAVFEIDTLRSYCSPQTSCIRDYFTYTTTDKSVEYDNPTGKDCPTFSFPKGKYKAADPLLNSFGPLSSIYGCKVKLIRVN